VYFAISARFAISVTFSFLICTGFKKTWVFKKKAQPSGFFWVLLGFLDKQEKIGKIIQKLSNLKP